MAKIGQRIMVLEDYLAGSREFDLTSLSKEELMFLAKAKAGADGFLVVDQSDPRSAALLQSIAGKLNL